MKKPLTIALALALTLALVSGCTNKTELENTKEKENQPMCYFPAEDEIHEGTWLTWPHPHTYGKRYVKSIEPIWITMAKELSQGEKVHIIAYDNKLKGHIEEVLSEAGAKLENIDFEIIKTDDVWVRDTGPIFAYDRDGKRIIVDFAFDGWGEKMAYKYDDVVPQKVAKAREIPILDASNMVLEGGSFEMSKDGTLMATRSSVISTNRNPNMTQEEAEALLRKYLGATNFIWLQGVVDEDITDAHIDGMARFYDENTILTVPEDNFFELFEDIQEDDYHTLTHAKNAKGEPYKIIEVSLTKENVNGLEYKGSYLNFYLGNEVLLLPVYGDENDDKAIEIMSKLYPNRRVVPINVCALYKNGGMLHCVTQQEILPTREGA